MKKALACSVALLALGLSTPLKAERVYVPVADVQGANGKPLATQLWISNFDGVERPYSAVFLRSETEGTRLSGSGALSRVPANKAAYLKRAAAEGETGLLEVDGDELAVNAWIQTSRGRRTFYTGVPVISERTQVEAGGTAYLNGLGHQGSQEVKSLDLVNLADETASCQVDFLGADGTDLGAGAAVDVPALSMRPFADALGLLSEPEARSARVSCDQPFYAYALTVDRGTSQVSFATPEQEFTAKALQTSGTKAGEPAAIVFTQDGLFHLVTKQTAKQILRVPVPKQMGMAIVTAEFDVVAGPWNPRQKSGAHNLIFFHRGRFRSDTLANVNALGPSKFLFKINQNLDMAPRANTKAEIGFTFLQGKTYRVRVISNAVTNLVSCILMEDGQVVRRMDFPGSARSQEITVPASGLIAEFGNYNNQALPEVSSLGWRFLNFRVEMVPK